MLALLRQWHGAQGLAADVQYYGQWMRDEAKKRIGHLYPLVEITKEMADVRTDLKPLVGQKFTVIAWLWARTVKSPNPAFAHVSVPLVSTFMLSLKAGKEAYVEPTISDGGYAFHVKVGNPFGRIGARNLSVLGFELFRPKARMSSIQPQKLCGWVRSDCSSPTRIGNFLQNIFWC